MATVKGKPKSELIDILGAAAEKAVRNLDREILNSFVTSFKKYPQYSSSSLTDRQVGLIDSILERLETIESLAIDDDCKNFVDGVIRRWSNQHPMYLANVPGKNSRVEKINRKMQLGDPLEQRDWEFLRDLNKGYTATWDSLSPGGELAPGNLCKVYPAQLHRSGYVAEKRVECLIIGNRQTSTGYSSSGYYAGEILIDVFHDGAVYTVAAAHIKPCRPRAPRKKKEV